MHMNYSSLDEFKPVQPKLRTMASLKTDDIPGAQPKRRYDKPLPIDPNYPTLLQKQESDSLRSSPNFPYPANPNESYAGHRSYDPNNLRNAAYESLKDILPLPAVRSPGASPTRKELKPVDLRSLPDYANIGQLRNPMYISYDNRNNKIPLKDDSPKRTLNYIQDSLDTLQKEVEEKSQSPTLPQESRSLREEFYQEPVQMSSPKSYYEEAQQSSQRPIPKSELHINIDFEDLKPLNQRGTFSNIEQERDVNRLHGFVSPSKLSRQFEVVSPKNLPPMKDANDYYIFNPVTLRYEFKYRSKPDPFKKTQEITSGGR